MKLRFLETLRKLRNLEVEKQTLFHLVYYIRRNNKIKQMPNIVVLVKYTILAPVWIVVIITMYDYC